MNAKVFLRKNGSTIMTCIGAAGVVGTGVLTVRATSKANELLAEAKALKGEELTKTEKFKIAAPAFISPIIVGAATVSCIFGSNILNKKHQESLAGAYVLLNESYKEYRKKVIDLYGEDANDKVDEAIMEENNKPRQ